MRIHLLGPVTATDGDRSIDLGGRRQRTVLAVLAAHAGRPVSTDRIADELWGDRQPESAANTVQSYVSRLRRLLGGDAISSTASGYVLQIQDIDAREFERLIHHGDPGSRAHRLSRALDLWQGRPYDGVDETPGIRAERTRLDELRMTALERWADAIIEAEEPDQAIPELERETERHPLRESLWLRLVTALAAAGRRSDALDAYRAVRTTLATELGIEPSRQLQDLELQVLQGTIGRPARRAAGVPAPGGRLPSPLTSFVGRDRELADVVSVVHANRLVTLTGPGGSGKTRLALEAARRTERDFEDGVMWVQLEDLTEPVLVVEAVAASVGISTEVEPGVLMRGRSPATILERLEESLADTEALIALDTCERLVDAVARMVEPLLQACPGLHVIATSREPLGIPGEVVWEVPPLALSSDDRSENDAVRLFVDRARATLPGFVVDERTSALIEDLCERLEGVPLSIELAAARLRALDLDEIAARIGDRLGFLSGGRSSRRRQESLRATLDWSLGLLSDDERLLFSRLSVFRGFDLGAVEQVAAGPPIDPGRTADLVASLVDKSMLVVTPGPAGRRFRMLDTVHEYARELVHPDEAGRLAAAHHAYVLALAERLALELRGPEGAAALARYDAELGNLHAALEWCLRGGDGEGALRLAGAAGPYWQVRGRADEALEWLERGLAQAPPPSPVVTDALAWAAQFAQALGQLPSAESYARSALEVAQGLDDDRALARGLIAIGTRFHQSDSMVRDDLRYLEEARRVFERLGDDVGQADCLVEQAWLATWSGELDMSARYAGEARRLYTRRGHLGGIGDCFLVEGQVAARLGKTEEATETFQRAREIADRLGARLASAWTSYHLGELARASDRFEEATVWYEEARDRFAAAHHGWGLAVVNGSWGTAARQLGDGDTACRRYAESLRLALTHHAEGSAIWMVESIAGVAADTGRYEAAARLHGAAEHRREADGLSRPQWDTWHGEDRERLRVALGEDTLGALLTEGARMGWDTAIALAREICAETE